MRFLLFLILLAGCSKEQPEPVYCYQCHTHYIAEVATNYAIQSDSDFSRWMTESTMKKMVSDYYVNKDGVYQKMECKLNKDVQSK